MKTLYYVHNFLRGNLGDPETVVATSPTEALDVVWERTQDRGDEVVVTRGTVREPGDERTLGYLEGVQSVLLTPFDVRERDRGDILRLLRGL